jgi:DNA invertase Pin-like site-specific DNA recombinase
MGVAFCCHSLFMGVYFCTLQYLHTRSYCVTFAPMKTEQVIKLPTGRNYVAYYRVSTARQGVSGLGLDAQKSCIECAVGSGNVLAEFTDIESGRKRDRVQLQQALKMCRETGAELIIAKLDRLARDVRFIFELRESGVQFFACDLPDFNTLTLGMFATFAQYEREKISERTKAALKAKKAREKGAWWGVSNLTEEAREKAHEAVRVKAKSNPNNVRARAFIKQATRGGKVSLRALAEQLNNAGFTTSQDKKFTAVQVSRLMK